MFMRCPEVVVAGHICLDIIPTYPDGKVINFCPGALLDTGPAIMATGGAVSNTGIALHKLGFATRLLGKVGTDLFGRGIVDIVRGYGEQLAEQMIVSPEVISSYTVVISPPGVDRIFLHCPGANHTFTSADVCDAMLNEARLLHFGYPPLMQQMYLHGGRECAAIMQQARRLGLTTSLDMARPDPQSEAGQVDWQRWLANVLPSVDIFLPSIDEVLFMLDRQQYDALLQRAGSDDLTSCVNAEILAEVSGRLLALGCAVVAIKLGNQGMYVRTSSDQQRLAAAGKAMPGDLASWCGRELMAPCYSVKVVGTTGSGDSTIAGFLAAVLKGLKPEAALQSAVAVGSCSVEVADASSGIRTWEQTQQRIGAGWAQDDIDLSLANWQRDSATGLRIGPNDRSRS